MTSDPPDSAWRVTSLRCGLVAVFALAVIIDIFLCVECLSALNAQIESFSVFSALFAFGCHLLASFRFSCSSHSIRAILTRPDRPSPFLRAVVMSSCSSSGLILNLIVWVFVTRRVYHI